MQLEEQCKPSVTLAQAFCSKPREAMPSPRKRMYSSSMVLNDIIVAV